MGLFQVFDGKALGVWVWIPVDKLFQVAVQVVLAEEALVGAYPGCDYGENYRRVVEHNGYTWRSPGYGKMDALSAQHGYRDFCHLGGAHGSFQLLDSLAA